MFITTHTILTWIIKGLNKLNTKIENKLNAEDVIRYQPEDAKLFVGCESACPTLFYDSYTKTVVSSDTGGKPL